MSKLTSISSISVFEASAFLGSITNEKLHVYCTCETDLGSLKLIQKGNEGWGFFPPFIVPNSK